MLSAFILTSSLSQGATIADDFNDGNDSGWTRYDPIGTATSGAMSSTFSFPGGNSYRVQAVASPDPVLLGPARAGAYRADSATSNFTVTIDVTSWNNSIEQGFGVLARGKEIGPATTDGYVLSYHNHEGGHLALEKLENEEISSINNGTLNSNFADVTLTPGNGYRLVFTGNGSALSGSIFDLADLATPLGTVVATDASYTSGVSGVLGFSVDGTGATDTTFDNFSSVPEPSSLLLVALGGLGLLRRSRK